MVFSTIMMTTGPIWGKPVWGTWWTWDARLTFTLLLILEPFIKYIQFSPVEILRHKMSALPSPL